MGFTESIKKVIGIEDIDDNDVYATDEEVAVAKERITAESRESRRPLSETITTESNRNRMAEKRFSVANTSAFRMVLIEPKTFEECPKLVDSLKGRRPIILNLEKLDTDVARKIFDFLSGATYALNGNVRKVANNIFIFAPENVDIAGEQEDKSGFELNQDEKNPWR